MAKESADAIREAHAIVMAQEARAEGQEIKRAIDKLYDVRTTIVSGIKCRRCNRLLPAMTMLQHLEGKYDPSCQRNHMLTDDD